MVEILPFGRGSQPGDAPIPDRVEGMQQAIASGDLEGLAGIVRDVAISRES